MTAFDAFSLSEKEWDEIESRFESVADNSAEEMLERLLIEADHHDQKWLALGIMIGRISIFPES